VNSVEGQNLHLRQGNKGRVVINKTCDVSFSGLINTRAVPGGIGALISNVGASRTANFARFVFHSMGNYSTYGINDMDDGYMVMPGYKVQILTNANHTGANATLDNTNGTQPLFFKLRNRVNQTSSCKLFYDNKEVTEPSVTFVDDY